MPDQFDTTVPGLAPPLPLPRTSALQGPPPASPNTDELTLAGTASKLPVFVHTPPPATDRYPHLPGFRVVGELGRGGMGVVYHARQERLNRPAAVKMLLHYDVSDLSDVIRFRSEAEAVAAIAHPHVVKVFESGQHDGRPYFAMEYLPGGTLHARLRKSAPFAPDEAAGLVEKLARAVHAAHALGIVHRDIKPGNVLFDAAGEPRITDFGLAKRTACELTRTQAVMGTPAYMPPEQAAGKAKYVGPAADIYAVGVILYECLAGRTPFASDDSLVLMHQVMADDPPPIRKRVPDTPRDLELICLKCLEKQPTDRYPSADALADDLRRFLAREPVSVRPAGVLERALKWARRRPTAAAAWGLGALAAVLLAFGGTASALAVQAAEARDRADGHARSAEAAKGELEVKAGELASKHELVEAALKDVRAANEVADREHKQVLAGREELVLTRYFRNVAFAYKEAAAGNCLRAVALLDDCPQASRGWEWWHAYRTAHTEVGSGVANGLLIHDAAFTGTGMDLTTAHPDGKVTKFTFAGGQGSQQRVAAEATALHLSADGKRAVAARQWGQEHADGVSVWELGTGKRLAAFPTPKTPCLGWELSADGRRVVFFHGGELGRAFEVDTGKELGRVGGEVEGAVRPALSADGRAGVVSVGKEALVWEVDTGAEVRRVGGDGRRVGAVGLSPDGKTVAVGTDGGGVRFHPTGGTPVTVKRAHVGAVTAIAFSADGKAAATAGDDGAVRVWNPATGEPLFTFRGHGRAMTAVAFHPDGSKLVSCDVAGGFRVWETRHAAPPAAPFFHAPHLKSAFAADRDLGRAFGCDGGRTGTDWTAKDRQFSTVSAPDGGTFAAAALPAVGRAKALATARGEVCLQLAPTETPLLLHTFRGPAVALKFSADSSRLLAAGDGEYRVWEAAGGRPVATVQSVTADPVADISPDGKRVAYRVGKGGIRVVELTDGGRANGYVAHSADDVSLLAFTPDGTGLVVGTRAWGLAEYALNAPRTGDALPPPARRYVGHTSPVTSVGYSPDGNRIAGGAADGSVRVWDVKTGHEAISLTTGGGPVAAVWFTGDGQMLAAQPEGSPPVVFDGSPRPLTIRPDPPKGK